MAMCAQAPRNRRLTDRAAEDLDPVTRSKADNCALGVRPLAPAESGPAPLARPVHCVDAGYPDIEDSLDGLPDLGLVRGGVDDERVLEIGKHTSELQSLSHLVC